MFDVWSISPLYIDSKIYIEKIFSKKYPNNIFDWLEGEIEIYTKYLEKKSNLVGGKYLEASGEHRGTVQNICETLRVSAQRIQICLTGEVETPSSPIWRQGLDAKYLEKVCAGCETSGWNGGGGEFWM